MRDLELVTRVLCDFVPNEVRLDAVHLMGQTAYNERSVLERGVELIVKERCTTLTIMDEEISGYPGGESWEPKIRGRTGIRNPGIWVLPFPIINNRMASNSYGEAVAVVEHARTQNWKTIGIVAQPLHQFRSFLGFVRVVNREFPELRVYNIVGTPLKWSEHVIHSQGVLSGTRANLLQQELVKIVDYQINGSLASFPEAIEYLDKRDGIA